MYKEYIQSDIHMEQYANEKNIYTKKTNAQNDIKIKEICVQGGQAYGETFTKKHLYKEHTHEAIYT